MAKHTQGKLKVGTSWDNEEHPITAIYDERYIYICSAVGDPQVISEGERKANAARLVECWNAHDRLVLALKTIRDEADADPDVVAIADAALKPQEK